MAAKEKDLTAGSGTPLGLGGIETLLAFLVYTKKELETVTDGPVA